MNYAVKLYTLACLAFIVLLSVSGSVGGIGGEIIYYLSFVLPFALCFISARRFKKEREEVSGVAEEPRRLLSLSREGALGTLLLIAPTILIVLVLSFLTTLLLQLAGASDAPVADAPIPLMLLEHALVPSLLEEMLFRYIPLLIIAPYSRRWCVIISSLYFALIHCSLFQLPYALIAGFIFIFVDLAFDSVLPSFILHLANNIASVLFMKLCTTDEAVTIYVIALVILSLLSAILLFLARTRVREAVRSGLEGGESLSTRSPIALAALSIGVAILNLF